MWAEYERGDEVAEQEKTWSIFLLALLALAILLAWQSPILYPFRLLVVFFHEMGHAAVALLTGGRVLEMRLSQDEGGQLLSVGGWRLAVLNGGYLGSLLSGVALLVLSRRGNLSRGLTISLGLMMVLVAVSLVRPFLSFGFFYCVCAGLGITLLGVKAPRSVSWFFCRSLGVLSIMYALVDIRDDVLLSNAAHVVTDATMLQEATGLPSVLWGLGWSVLGLALLWLLRKSLV